MPDDILLPELRRALHDAKSKKAKSNAGLGLLLNKPFWIWDKADHKTAFVKTKGQCCFNHIVGLPVKNNKSRPLYAYQKLVYDMSIEKVELAKLTNEQVIEKYGEKYVKRLGIWIEKATGMGISEFYLRFMGWLCTKDSYYKGSHFCIVTGPRVELAKGLIDRLKALFIENLQCRFDDAAHVLMLNGVRIEAFPSHNLSSMRGLPNVKFVLLDEADFFEKSQQENARAVAERYIAKSSSVIVMVSTPNPDEPEGLYAKMNVQFDEAEKKGTLLDLLYDRIQLPYSMGLESKGVPNMFTKAEIDSAKLSPSFETEYNLQRGFGLGNLLLPETITKIIELGEKYGDESIDVNKSFIPSSTFELVLDPNMLYTRKDIKYDRDLFLPTIGTPKIMGVDGAFGSSKFAICIVEFLEKDSIIRVLYADEFERIDYDAAINRCENLIKFYNIKRVYIDGASPEVVSGIRKIFGEHYDYTLDRRPQKAWAGYPVSFSKEGRGMLARLQRIATMGNLAIHPHFEELIVQLRIAKHNAYALEKIGRTQLDLIDALRLACKHFTFQ